MRYFSLLLALFTFYSVQSEANYNFLPTRQDLSVFKQILTNTYKDSKLIIIADGQHRLPNTRSATTLLISEMTKAYPNEKICLFLETTPKVNEAWKLFKENGVSKESYKNTFFNIGKQIASSVNGLTPKNATRIFVEPSFEMATSLVGNKNLNIFGVDVDYTSSEIFKPLYENAKPPRKMDDNEFAKIFMRDRNEAMANQINNKFKSKDCDRGVLSVGNAHVNDWNGHSSRFPNYSDGTIKGVASLIDPSHIKSVSLLRMEVDRNRICPQGGAIRALPQCKVSFELDETHGNIILPKNFSKSRTIVINHNQNTLLLRDGQYTGAN